MNLSLDSVCYRWKCLREAWKINYLDGLFSEHSLGDRIFLLKEAFGWASSKPSAAPPKFLHTYSKLVKMNSYETHCINIYLPVMQNHPRFHILGMSILITGAKSEELSQIGTGIATIYSGHHDRVFEHPIRVLLVPTLETTLVSSFKPGWITDFYVSSASTISAQITNHLSTPISLQFAVHGSFEDEESRNH